MLQLEAPPGPRTRFALVPENRVVRGGTPGPGDLAASWVEISAPRVVALTEGLIGQDAELRAFWEAERAHYSYDFVSFICGFGPAKGEPFTKAWVTVNLEGPANGEAPKVWSMTPRALTEPVKITQAAKLTGKLELVGLEAGTEVSIEHEIKNYLLRAVQASPSNPYWELRDQPNAPLEGDFDLRLVIRRRANLPASGKIAAKVIVARRSFLIFSREAELEDRPAITFLLGEPPGSATVT